jgi:hypothetical protein
MTQLILLNVRLEEYFQGVKHGREYFDFDHPKNRQLID